MVRNRNWQLKFGKAKRLPKLFEQINQDLKRAMKAKEGLTTSVLSRLIAAARHKEISLRRGDKIELADEQFIEVIASEINKRRDSIAAYERGQRRDLADKEAGEIKILEKYMPAQMFDRELLTIIKEIIAGRKNDFGTVMGRVMARVKGRAEGGKVGELVKKLFPYQPFYIVKHGFF